MSRRLKRLLFMATTTVLLTVVVLIGLFFVFVYNPFEGRVKSIDRLVPRSVAFFVSKPGFGEDLRNLQDQPTFQQLQDSPGVQAFLSSKEFNSADRIYAIQDNLDRIRELNTALPIDIFHDAIGEEIGLAGSPLGPDVTTWDYVFYTRVSWKVRAALDLCTHPQVKKRMPLDPGMDLADVEGGAFKQFSYRRGGKTHRFFFNRVKDVLVLTNKVELIREVMALGKGGAGTSLFFDRTYQNPVDFALGEDESDNLEISPVGMYLDLKEIRRLFGFDQRLEARQFGTATRIFCDMVGVRSMGQLFGAIRLESPVVFDGRIRLTVDDEGSVRRRILTTPGLPVAEVRDRLGAFLPAQTFFFVFMRCGVKDLFELITTNFSAADRRLINDALKKIPDFSNLEDFLGKTSSHFTDEIVAVFSRRDLETLTGADRYSPKPGMTLVLQTLDADRLKEYLAILERDEFAISSIQREEVEGVSVTSGTSKVDGATLAYAIMEPHFVISSSRAFLDEVILTNTGKRSGLKEDPTFGSAFDAFGEKTTFLFYLNVGKGAGWVQDYSAKLANDIHFLGPDAWLKFRSEVRQELAADRSLRGEALEEAISRRAEIHQSRIDAVEIPLAIEDIKRYTEWPQVIRALAGSLSYQGDSVVAKGVAHLATAQP